MKNSLAIVLPVYNAESQLRANVQELLDLAAELTDDFRIVIVDDGSIDDTFDVASELAAEFPQVSVYRNALRRGVGFVRNEFCARLDSDVVVVHDGEAPLDVDQLRCLWRDHVQSLRQGMAALAEDSIGDLAGVSGLQAALSRAHRRIVGFTLMPSMTVNDSSHGGRIQPEVPFRERRIKHSPADRVGRIPALPRPNFLRALTDFALGE